MSKQQAIVYLLHPPDLDLKVNILAHLLDEDELLRLVVAAAGMAKAVTMADDPREVDLQRVKQEILPQVVSMTAGMDTSLQVDRLIEAANVLSVIALRAIEKL